MHQPLINYINNHLSGSLSDIEVEVIKDTFKPMNLRKNRFFLREGEICKRACFIVKGAMKQYTVDDSGKENILSLLIDNWWAGDRESMASGTPTPYFIDAVEPTELLVISKEDSEKHLDNLHFMHELKRVLTERQAFQLMRRLHAAQTFNAEQRLADLEKNYPEFLQRFPQHIIASYLLFFKEK